MAAKIVLNTLGLVDQLYIYSNYLRSNAERDYCRYFKGAIEKVARVNEEYSSKKLEREIIEKFINLNVAGREVEVCLINSEHSKNHTTKLILYGKLLDSVVTSFPQLSMTVTGTIQVTKQERDSIGEIFGIPLTAELFPVTEALEEELFGQPYLRIWNSRMKWENTSLFIADLKFTALVTQVFTHNWSISDFEVTIILPKTNLGVGDSIGLSVAQGYLNKMLMESEHTDLTIVAEDGTEIKCQKSFLEVHSDVFKVMLAKGSETKESESNRIEMVDMSGAGVQAFLQFLYSLDMKAAQDNGMIALELLQAGHKYNIKLLESAMVRLFLSWPGEWCDFDDLKVAIRLFCFARKVVELEQLKILAVRILKSRSKELDESETFTNLFITDAPAAKDLSLSTFALLN